MEKDIREELIEVKNLRIQAQEEIISNQREIIKVLQEIISLRKPYPTN